MYLKKIRKIFFSLTNRAIEFIESSTSKGAPFYLQISHYAVHSDIESKEKVTFIFQEKPKGAQQKDQGFAAMTFDLDEGLGVLLKK